MTLYYQDDTVQVTSERIQVDGHSIDLRDIGYVWHAQGQAGLAERSRLLGRGVLVLLLSLPPLVALVCLISLGYAAQDRGEWGTVLIIVAVCAAVGLALAPFLEVPLGWLDRSYDRGSRVHELWIRHHGRETMLLRSSDGLRFGQIYRAVQRAVEYRTES